MNRFAFIAVPFMALATPGAAESFEINPIAAIETGAFAPKGGR